MTHNKNQLSLVPTPILTDAVGSGGSTFTNIPFLFQPVV